MTIIKMLLLPIMTMCLFASCGSDLTEDGSIDVDKFSSLEGEYQVEYSDEVGSWWNLSIDIYEDDEYHLTIFDGEAGNPGVEGTIVDLSKDSMTIKVNQESYEELPTSKWKMDGDHLTLKYKKEGCSITLSNHGFDIKFSIPFTTIAGFWNSDEEYHIDKFTFNHGRITTKGHTHENGDAESYGLDNEAGDELCIARDCRFYDEYTGSVEISQKEFQDLLKDGKSAGGVIEIIYSADTAYEIRLVKYQNSILSLMKYEGSGSYPDKSGF